MSQISLSRKMQSPWKISDSSKIYPNEVSMREAKNLLPERFSPSKSISKDSKIFTASKEKFNLGRNNTGTSPSITPRKNTFTILPVNNSALK